VLVLAAAAGVPGTARAQAADPTSPAGWWKTIDDDTGKAKSVVLLSVKDGQLTGMILSIIPEPGQTPDPICDKCEGERKGKPVKGMTIMWGLRKDGDEWSGGKVLDPANGKIYRCYVEVVDRGAHLKVRGYVGISLFGRTQYWQRLR
jgi:uncharacterized protein (DUF2147 family)